ncbi:MAG: ABC transporter substrate-binding protein [Chloroflexi bacterium]|nr:ABC transporter substrate-binding protein [Chloroflexota bacterium]
MSRLTRKWQLVVFLVFSMLWSILAACGATPTPEVKVQEKVVTQVVTQIVEKQVQVKETIVVEKVVEKPVLITPTAVPTAVGSDLAADQTIRYVTRGFSRLDPASEGGFQRAFISHVFMPLFLRDEKNNLIPWLATKYEVNAEGTVYTIHINPKAVWSDGSPVTAQEAKDYWIYALDPKGCVACRFAERAGFDIVKGAKELGAGTATDLPGLVIKDEKTLEFNLTGPDPIFVNRLALFNTGFVKMEDVKKGPMFAADGKVRTNGPFMVKVWDVDKKQYEIVQNPKWWGDTKPKITRIVGLEAPDENISFIQWQNNEVDVAHWLTNIREKLRADQKNTFNLIPYPTNFYFPMKMNIEPMDDLNLRKALVHAVDWVKAVGAAWEGARDGRLMKTILTPEMACYKADNWPDFGFNTTKAKDELSKSKYVSGDKVPKIRITTNGQSPNYIRMAEIMAEQWKTNLGITDVEIKPGTIDAWGQDAAKVQILRESAGAIIPDSAAFVTYHYKRYSGTVAGTGLDDAEVGKLIDQLTVMKRDDPKYCATVQEAESKLLDDYYFLPMVWDLYEYNAKPWVKNFHVNVDNNWYTLENIYIVKH